MIFLDTNVISETLKKQPDPVILLWLTKFDAELALSSIVIAEIAFGIQKIRPDERAERLANGLARWRHRFADRTFGLNEEAALAYGEMMGEAARRGHSLSAQDGMIAAIALLNGGRLATRNIRDFQGLGLDLVSPWDFKA